MNSATDVTGHRFKTLVRRRQNAVAHTVDVDKKPPTPAAVGDGGMEQQRSNSPVIAARGSSAARQNRPVEGGVGSSAGEGVFTAEERRRYVIPEDVQQLLPVPYRQLLPTKSMQGDGFSGETYAESTAMPDISSKTPWGSWLASLPRWNWLEAESLPTPKAVILPPSLIRHEAPQLLPTKNTSRVSKGNHPVPALTTNKGPTRKQPSSESRSLLPVPSLRARGICPYELRRHRLATAGRELQREASCPLGMSIYSSIARVASLTSKPILVLYVQVVMKK